MLIVLLILIPLLGGLAAMLMPERNVHIHAVGVAITTLALAVAGYFHFTMNTPGIDLVYQHSWIESLGATFSVGLTDGLSILMVLLTAIIFPFIFISIRNKQPERKNTFYGLMLLAQAGLMGVFLAQDALLFYVFWEVALIPVYFLSSMYGGPRRIPVTFKFFVYTFAGSLIMLAAFLMIYQHTAHQFSFGSFVGAGASLEAGQQNLLFWMIFIAFAIKMPIFPFHTWQPDAYEQSATPVTIVLSAIMVKMGLFAVIRWLIPVLPLASVRWMDLILLLSVVSVVFGSIMAMVQTNIKRLIAYSSIAHIGLMSAAIFSQQAVGLQGVAIQMFNHGINIMGLWIIVSILENRLKTQDLREMGGIAKVAPAFTIALVVISLANIALPLTNGFVGEFMMFNGLFNAASPYRIAFTVAAGLGVILSAVYTLTMIQKVAYGNTNSLTEGFKDLTINEKLILILIILIILWLGFYPKMLMGLVNV
ncbi:MAG: NADH-quinone oxidoreductase subunit M [Chitinophagaceae bacterium]|nr:NADH-quinone oxidoreductase subunit M [Chitinophagaceae bacterium]